MTYRAVVLDIDGTLYNNEKKITLKTKEILLNIQKKGVKLILASGRPTRGLIKIAKSLEMDKYHGLLVSYNGSQVVDLSNNEVLFNEALTVDEAKKVLHHLKKFPKVRAIIDKNDYMYVEDVYNCFINVDGKDLNIYRRESSGNNFKLCEVDDLEEFVDFKLNKILSTSDPSFLNEVYLMMQEPFVDKLNCSFTSKFYFEFTAKGIDKAKALDSVLSKLGYSKDEIIAFGDGHNDVSMVKYAGLGVAMGNAVEELKEIADEITLSNNEDGIAFTLDKYF